MLNLVDVLGHTTRQLGTCTNVCAHQQTHNWPVAALHHESQDVFTLLSMPIKQLGMSLLMPEKSGLNSAWASMCDWKVD